MSTKIALSANAPWVIYNFRLELIRHLQNKGYEVVTIASVSKYFENELKYVTLLENEGCKFYNVDIKSKGKNPICDLFTFISYYRLYKKVRPSIILNFTIKPNVYGTIAARALKIPVINNIAGLGALFTNQSIFTRIALILYKISQKHTSTIFFQNRDDMDLFCRKKIIDKAKADLLPGSGIDISKFTPMRKTKDLDKIVFLIAARMLREKGIVEYVEAAKIVKAKYANVRFLLLGFLDMNKSAITSDEMNAFVEDGNVEYLGTSDNVIEHIQNTDCIVLPSYYREGVPRTLLEAASMAKPVITTNAVGCKDVVEDGVNGLICKIKDPVDLANKMIMIISLNEFERIEMGKRGREKMIREFDVNIVLLKYITAIENILESRLINVHRDHQRI